MEEKTNEKNTVMCTNCMWEGQEEDLLLVRDLSNTDIDIEYYNVCPSCGTDDYLKDIEEWTKQN